MPETIKGSRLSLAQLTELLTVEGSGAADIRIRALKDALFSSSSLSKCLSLAGPLEWQAFLRLVLSACLGKMDARGVTDSVQAIQSETAEFLRTNAPALADLWPALAACVPTVVSHSPKQVNGQAANNVFFRKTPSVGHLGVLGSGDIEQHRYTSGAAGIYLGKRHIFEAGAYKDGTWTMLVDELASPTSDTWAYLSSLGAPASLASLMQRNFGQDHSPDALPQELRQVYATCPDGTDVLLTPLPSVSSSAFFANFRAPDGFWLAREYMQVGGTKPGNVSGLALNLSGKMTVLSARLPLPQSEQPLRRAFYPAALLKTISASDTTFLMVGHDTWSNQQCRDYYIPRLDKLLIAMFGPLWELAELLQESPAVLQSAPFTAGSPQLAHPLLQLAMGELSSGTRQACHVLVREKILASLDKQVPRRVTRELLDKSIKAYLESV